VIWVALWLILTGLFAIYTAILERRVDLSSWGWTLIFGIVAGIVGILALLSPGMTVAAVIGLIAAFAIVGGIVLLIGAFRLSSARREITGAVGSARAGF
jgi:uncharacterized membrane protein HdeD (DUF308 family)